VIRLFVAAALLCAFRTGAERGARPARYIAGRLICAVNVGSALAQRGIKGTGSAVGPVLSQVGEGVGTRARVLLRCPAGAAEDTSRSSVASKAIRSTSGIHRPEAAAGRKSHAVIALSATGCRGHQPARARRPGDVHHRFRRLSVFIIRRNGRSKSVAPVASGVSTKTWSPAPFGTADGFFAFGLASVPISCSKCE
jgi:hypothetical protein